MYQTLYSLEKMSNFHLKGLQRFFSSLRSKEELHFKEGQTKNVDKQQVELHFNSGHQRNERGHMH